MVSGNIHNIYLLTVIALFVLLMAAINFINLSTARAAERAKEIGIRKLSGAGKDQLIGQFMSESLLLSLLAFLLSIGLITLLLPLFNQLAGKIVCTNIFLQPRLLLDLLLLTIAIGGVVGSYPAFVLSSYDPLRTLKRPNAGGIPLRTALVIGQFALSATLIIATIVMYLQLQFMRTNDPGFNKAQDLVIDTRTDPHGAVFKKEIAQIPAVLSSTFSSSIPGAIIDAPQSISTDPTTIPTEVYAIDFDFLAQYQIPLLAGRSFQPGFATDSNNAVIINETAVKTLGYSSPQQILGKKITLATPPGTIIGVIRNFHTRSLRDPILPLLLKIDPGHANEYLSIKLTTHNLPATLQALERKWNELIPYRPFNYFFLDEYFDRQYRADQQFGRLFLSFSILILLIACLGLYSLSSFSAIQRKKEIAIRKVAGASVTALVILLSKDFLKYILLFLSHRLPAELVFHAPMAQRLRLPHRYKLVDFPDSRMVGRLSRTGHDRLSGYAPGTKKSRNQPEIFVI